MSPEPTFTTTTELLAQARRGDRRSFEQLVERYRDQLLERIRLMMGEAVRERIESGDIVQEVLTEALRDLDRFVPNGESAWLRWLTQIARNNIRDHGKRHRLPLLDTLSVALSGGTPSVAVSKREQVALLVEAIAGLPAEHKRLIELRHFEGLSFAAIGSAMNRSENAVQLLHARVLTGLGAALGREQSA